MSKQEKKPGGTTINGIRVPAGVDKWRVFRYPDPAGKGQPVACAFPYEGRRIDWLPIEHAPPDWPIVLAKWGSGTYRIQWGRADSKPAGFTSPMTFDDPAHPQLPPYQSPRPAASAPEPPAAPAASGPTVLDALAATAKDGKIELPMVMLLLQMVGAQSEAAERRYRQWMAEEADRRRQQDAEHMQRLQQQQAWADQQAQALAAFWRGQTEAARELARSPVDDDREDRLAEAIEAMNERIEQVAQAPAANEEAWERMIEKFAPIIAARFLAQPPAPPPNGQTGGT